MYSLRELFGTYVERCFFLVGENKVKQSLDAITFDKAPFLNSLLLSVYTRSLMSKLFVLVFRSIARLTCAGDKRHEKYALLHPYHYFLLTMSDD